MAKMPALNVRGLKKLLEGMDDDTMVMLGLANNDEAFQVHYLYAVVCDPPIEDINDKPPVVLFFDDFGNLEFTY